MIIKVLEELRGLAVSGGLLRDGLQKAAEPQFRHLHIARDAESIEMLASNCEQGP